MPITGVGQIASPSVSLYRLTLPPVIGVSKKRQASLDALDGFDELRHDLRPLRIAEVQIVGGGHRHRAHGRKIAAALGDQQLAPSRGESAQ